MSNSLRPIVLKTRSRRIYWEDDTINSRSLGETVSYVETAGRWRYSFGNLVFTGLYAIGLRNQ
jgi:hypothetical protein